MEENGEENDEEFSTKLVMAKSKMHNRKENMEIKEFMICFN